jgi:preprotein translocase subunit SecA
MLSEAIRTTIENRLRPQNTLQVVDPFEQKNFLQKRISEGYFGPTASLDRSIACEQNASPFVNQIKTDIAHWNALYSRNPSEAHTERNIKLRQLEKKWQTIPKGGIEEQEWTAAAVATVSASFEYYMASEKEQPFSFFDSQLYYMSLMTLDEGNYEFGELSTHQRGVQLDTGEGKTICSGVLAGVLSLKQEPVHIIEQNYVSALEHAKEMAPFLEQFLQIETGVVVDLSSKAGIHIKKYFDEKGLLHIEPLLGDQRESYVYLGDKKRKTDRSYAWGRKIVYTDTNSLSTDRTLDSRIEAKDKSGMPPLKRAIALIQEADDVMIDRAQSPSVIDKTISGNEGAKQSDIVWDTIADSFFHVWEGKPISHETKRDLAQQLVYGVWANLDLLGQVPNFFKNGGENATYALTSSGVAMKDNLLQKVEENIIPRLSGLFGSPEETTRYFKKNPHIIQTAVQIYLGHKPDVGFISGKDPVLMDKHGVPLDKRQLRDLEHIFLQIDNIWQQEGLHGKKVTAEDIERVMNKSIHTFSVSQGTVARRYPSTIFKEYGTMRVTSGSLIPVAETMENVYGAETLAVSRHVPIPEQVHDKSEKKLITKCLDGGEAEVQFVDLKNRSVLIAEQILELQKAGRGALIIMPNAIEARQLALDIEQWVSIKKLSNGVEREDEIQVLLKKLESNLVNKGGEVYVGHTINPHATEEAKAYKKVIATLRELSVGEEEKRKNDRLSMPVSVITGKEELAKRGTLSEGVSEILPGNIIITTSMAHRDINPHLTKEVKKNGGMEVIVCGAANERGLWQALQRTIRSDEPGSRRLILTEQDMYPISHSGILNNDPLPSPFLVYKRREMHEDKVKRYQKLWNESNNGNISAKATMYRSYLGELRSREDRERVGLLYTTAREEHMMNIQTAYLKKLESASWWKPYLKKQTIKWFYADQRKRSAIIPTGDMEYMQKSQAAQSYIRETYWAEMLDLIDLESTRFSLESLEAQKAPTIMEYQKLWDLHMYELIHNMKLKKPTELGL